jgi:hypothetical protein
MPVQVLLFAVRCDIPSAAAAAVGGGIQISARDWSNPDRGCGGVQISNGMLEIEVVPFSAGEGSRREALSLSELSVRRLAVWQGCATVPP